MIVKSFQTLQDARGLYRCLDLALAARSNYNLGKPDRKTQNQGFRQAATIEK
jgi:hypothetical protein